jgi:hypothetical protein
VVDLGVPSRASAITAATTTAAIAAAKDQYKAGGPTDEPQAALGFPGAVIAFNGAAAENGGGVPPDRAAEQHAAAHRVTKSPAEERTAVANTASLILVVKLDVAGMTRLRTCGVTPRRIS